MGELTGRERKLLSLRLRIYTRTTRYLHLPEGINLRRFPTKIPTDSSIFPVSLPLSLTILRRRPSLQGSIAVEDAHTATIILYRKICHWFVSHLHSNATASGAAASKAMTHALLAGQIFDEHYSFRPSASQLILVEIF